MTRIIITGIEGQDGTILTQILKKHNFSIYGISKKNKFKTKIKSKKIKYSNINIFNYYKLEKFIKKINPNVIIHLGSTNPSYKETFTLNDYKKNLKIVKNFTNIIIKNNKKIGFIFSNSSQIFKKKKGTVSEKSSFKVSDYYTKFRIKAATIILKNKKKFKLNMTNLILFNHDSRYRNKKFLLPRILLSIKNKNYDFLYKIYHQNIQIDCSHAFDICNAIFLLIKKNIYPDNLILSSGKITRINNIIDFFLKKVSKFKRPVKIKKNDLVLKGDNSLSKRLLGWSHQKNSLIAAKDIYNSLKV